MYVPICGPSLVWLPYLIYEPAVLSSFNSQFTGCRPTGHCDHSSTCCNPIWLPCRTLWSPEGWCRIAQTTDTPLHAKSLPVIYPNCHSTVQTRFPAPLSILSPSTVNYDVVSISSIDWLIDLCVHRVSQKTISCLFYCSVYMLTDFYNIWHRVYWDNMQHKNYWFAHLTYLMLLHYLGKNELLIWRSLTVFRA